MASMRNPDEAAKAMESGVSNCAILIFSGYHRIFHVGSQPWEPLAVPFITTMKSDFHDSERSFELSETGGRDMKTAMWTGTSGLRTSFRTVKLAVGKA